MEGWGERGRIITEEGSQSASESTDSLPIHLAHATRAFASASNDICEKERKRESVRTRAHARAKERKREIHTVSVCA